jgi:hypothetical protein
MPPAATTRRGSFCTDHDAQEGIIFEDGIGIDYANVGMGSGIQSGIHGTRFASARLLVHYQKPRFGAAYIEPADPFAGNVVDVNNVRGKQFKMALELRKSGIGRAVVYDDDLELGIIDGKERLNRIHNGLFLVMRGRDERNRRHERRELHAVEPHAVNTALMSGAGAERDDEKHEVEEIREQVINKQRAVRNLQKPQHQTGTLTGFLPRTSCFSPLRAYSTTLRWRAESDEFKSSCNCGSKRASPDPATMRATAARTRGCA